MLKQELVQKRVAGSGLVAKKMNKKYIAKLKAIFDNKDGVSQRQAAKVFKCHYSFVNKALMKHTEIRCRKKKQFQSEGSTETKSINTLWSFLPKIQKPPLGYR